ncbi:MAG: hypothetical protein ACOZF0_16450 [Thermodesulfobacteriota bacterium]
MGNPEQTVVHRKIFAPWYDTEAACFITIVLVAPVLLFSIAGIITAYEDTAFHPYGWVPIILCIMCLWVLLSISIRLAKRYIARMDSGYLKG